MRIVILSSEFPPGPGGIGAHALELARHLKEIGHDIFVLTNQNYVSWDAANKFNREREFGVQRFDPKGGSLQKLSARFLALKKIAKDWKPDLLLASGDRMVYLSALAQAMGLPWVAVEHGRVPSCKWERKLKRWSLNRSTGVVCVSNYTYKMMISMGARPRKSQIIHNGIDSQKIPKPSVDEIRGFIDKNNLAGKRIITTVGHVSIRKGQDIVIRALPRILKAVSNTHYVIVGIPEKKEEYQKIAQELGVEDHVHFLGQIESREVSCLLSVCDLFVMTSRRGPDGDFEGFGIAVLEAALYGKPAVVAKDSGMVEAIQEGVTGRAVESENPDQTAGVILELLQNDELRKKMGESAKTRAVNEQTWASRVKEYEIFFRTVL